MSTKLRDVRSRTAPLHPGLTALVELLRGRRVVVLAGAGCSTESGIPDYRGPDGRRTPRTPIQYLEFVRRAETRRRYWARSAVGWARVASARPNPGHQALARMEHAGVVRGVITQNVDGLHQAAGSRRVLELHGSLAFVRCLECGLRLRRDRVQERIVELNGPGVEGGHGAGRDPRVDGDPGVDGDPDAGEGPGATRTTARAAPDGDAELPDHLLDGFLVPECERCGGTLKPDVVFFGETVPKDRVERAWRLFEEADALLVVGSSLTVYSGRRFTQRAEREGLPIGIVNLGPTRADRAAAVRVEGPTGQVLPRMAERLLGVEGR